MMKLIYIIFLCVLTLHKTYATNNLHYVNASYFQAPNPGIDIVINDNGNIYYADANGINKITINTNAGPTSTLLFSQSNIQGITYRSQTFYISCGSQVLKYTYSGGSWSQTATITGFTFPQGLCTDTSGNVFVADAGANQIFVIYSDQTTATVWAGNGGANYLDGTGADAYFNSPQGVAYNPISNSIIVADSYNNVIRKIALGSVAVTTLAGNQSIDPPGYADGVGASALFNTPTRLVCDSAGNVFVADNNSVIRKITQNGVITTVAGTVGQLEPLSGIGLFAQFSPTALTLNPTTGVLYFVDPNSSQIGSITPNYVDPSVVVEPITTTFDNYPITFAGGVLNLSKNITLTNDIVLSALTVINTNGYTLTLTGTATGTAKLLTFGGGSVSWTNGAAYVVTTDSSVAVVSSGISPYSSSYPNIILTGGTLTLSSDTSNTRVIYVLGAATIKANDNRNINCPICVVNTTLTLDCNGHNISLYQPISGTGGVTFNSSSGTGSITLNTYPSTYTGNTAINSSVTLVSNCLNAISASSSVTVNGTLDLSGNQQLIHNLSGSGIISDSAGDSLTVLMTQSQTYSGTFDSSLESVTILGPNALTLSGNNSSYANGITVGNGTTMGIVNISSPNNLGTGTVTFNEGSVLQLSGRRVTLTDQQSITLFGNAIFDTMGHNLDLSSASITDNSYALLAIQGGSVTFPDSYPENVYYKEGTAILGINAIPYSPGSPGFPIYFLQNSTFTASISLSQNIYFYGSTPILEAGTNNLNMTGTLNLITTGKLDPNGNTLTYSGNIAGGMSLTLKNTNQNRGTVILTGNNSYTGGATIGANTTGMVYDSMNLGEGPVNLNGGTLQVAPDTVINNNMSLIAGSFLKVLNDGSSGTTITYAGNISGNSYNLTLQNSNGTIILTGNNNHGGTTIDVNTIGVISQYALGTGPVTVQSGGVFQVQGSGTVSNDITFN